MWRQPFSGQINTSHLMLIPGARTGIWIYYTVRRASLTLGQSTSTDAVTSQNVECIALVSVHVWWTRSSSLRNVRDDCTRGDLAIGGSSSTASRSDMTHGRRKMSTAIKRSRTDGVNAPQCALRILMCRVCTRRLLQSLKAFAVKRIFIVCYKLDK